MYKRQVLGSSQAYRSVRARLPLASLERLAADPKVKFVSSERKAVTNRAGAATAALPRPETRPRTEGDVTHRAALSRSAFGASGAGVKVGVLSDGVDSLAALRAEGFLPYVTVLAGQAGKGDEGTAMLEIVHEIAPLAELHFATAVDSIESFARNIKALRAAGCDVIVDDVTYLVE